MKKFNYLTNKYEESNDPIGDALNFSFPVVEQQSIPDEIIKTKQRAPSLVADNVPAMSESIPDDVKQELYKNIAQKFGLDKYTSQDRQALVDQNNEDASGFNWQAAIGGLGSAIAGKGSTGADEIINTQEKNRQKKLDQFDKQKASAVEDMKISQQSDAIDPNSAASQNFRKIIEVNFPSVAKAYGPMWSNVTAADQDAIFKPLQLKEQIEARKQQAQMQMDLKREEIKRKNMPDERLKNLSGTDKARFDNVQMVLKGIDDMGAALDNGQNTFSVVGDNDYTAASRRATEAYGRMQSGGAINKEEEKRFEATLPGMRDSKEMQRKKLMVQRDEMISRLKTLGFNPQDIGYQPRDFNYGSNNEASYDFSDFDQPGLVDTVAGKIANGATLGFIDEMSGGLEALGQAAGVKGLGGKAKDWGFTDAGPTLDVDKLEQAYVQGRDRERILQDEITNAHPVVSTTADIAGSAALAPMSGGASLGARVLGASALGAVAGLGTSNADLTKGDVVGAVKDAAVGGALGGVLQYGGEKIISPALNKAGRWISESGPAKAIGKTLASVSPENTERYLSRSRNVNSALEMEDIGQYFKDDALEQFQNHLSNLDNEAWKTLKTQPELNKNDILQMGDDFVQKILSGKNGELTRSAGTGADADRIKVIYQQLEEIKNAYGSNLSESDLKSVVQSLQKLGWSLEGSPRTSIQGQAIQQLSGLYNDVLKSVNPIYAEKMVPVQEATSTLQSINRQFVNQQAPEQMDKFLRTAKKFGNLSDESEALKAIRGLDKTTGAGVEDMIRDRLTHDSFLKSDTNGSRKTLAGALLGKAAEGAIGGVIGYNVSDGSGTGAATGAMVGLSLDKYAGQVFKQILNSQMSAAEGVQKIAPYIGKFAKPLMDAASRGNTAVSATHFILQQSNPEYREMLKKMNNEK